MILLLTHQGVFTKVASVSCVRSSVTWGHKLEVDLTKMPWVTSTGSKIWHKQGMQFNFLIYKTNWGPCLVESGAHRPARILEKSSGLRSEWRVNMSQVDCSPMGGNVRVGMNQINRGKWNQMPSITLGATWAKSLNMEEVVNKQLNVGRRGKAQWPAGGTSMTRLLGCLK